MTGLRRVCDTQAPWVIGCFLHFEAVQVLIRRKEILNWMVGNPGNKPKIYEMESGSLCARLLLKDHRSSGMQECSCCRVAVFSQSCQENWDWFSNLSESTLRNTCQHSDTLQSCENQCVFQFYLQNLSKLSCAFSPMVPLGQATTPLTSL